MVKATCDIDIWCHNLNPKGKQIWCKRHRKERVADNALLALPRRQAVESSSIVFWPSREWELSAFVFCSKKFRKYSAKTPQSLTSQFPDRISKPEAVKDYEKRKQKTRSQLFPTGRIPLLIGNSVWKDSIILRFTFMLFLLFYKGCLQKEDLRPKYEDLFFHMPIKPQTSKLGQRFSSDNWHEINVVFILQMRPARTTKWRPSLNCFVRC